MITQSKTYHYDNKFNENVDFKFDGTGRIVNWDGIDLRGLLWNNPSDEIPPIVAIRTMKTYFSFFFHISCRK